MTYNLRYSRFNDFSILIEWPAVIDVLMHKNILSFKNHIETSCVKQNIEVIISYNSLLVIYATTIDNVNGQILRLKLLYSEHKEPEKHKSTLWEIPVCYDGEFGLDLEAFSIVKSIPKSEIIKRHSKPIYTVFFIGFLPGFLYLGGLDPSLFLDRKTTPNRNVKKGSVAIGGQQTGIYPQDSPGGWHCIGNSPIVLFDPIQKPPCFIKAGDQVKFVPVEKLEYYEILNRIKRSDYHLKSVRGNA